MGRNSLLRKYLLDRNSVEPGTKKYTDSVGRMKQFTLNITIESLNHYLSNGAIRSNGLNSFNKIINNTFSFSFWEAIESILIGWIIDHRQSHNIKTVGWCLSTRMCLRHSSRGFAHNA